MRLRTLGAFSALAVLATLLLAVSAAGAPASSEVKPYIVVMKLNPIVAYDGDVAGIPATKPAKGEKVNTRSAAAKRYADYLGGLAQPVARERRCRHGEEDERLHGRAQRLLGSAHPRAG